MDITNAVRKITNWEYWPSSMLYIPNLPYAFYLACKARSLTFFTAVNPSIKSSGNGAESKYITLQLIPEKYRPKSILIKPTTDFSEVLNKINSINLNYPLIVKPDIGFRGLLVKKIISPEELKIYLKKHAIDIIIQEFISLKNECGLFYYRLPKKKKGHITSITLKKFLSVTGDGKSSIEALILKDKRAKLYFEILKKTVAFSLKTIPKKNEQINLSSIGNHSKGTQFIDGNHLISEQLCQTFDKVNNSIPNWYYGRLDIKYNSFDELEKGENFKILEINGVIAEPTHIYDSKNFSYIEALKEIRSHWKNLYEVATANHKFFDAPYKPLTEFIKEIIYLKNYLSNIKKIN